VTRPRALALAAVLPLLLASAVLAAARVVVTWHPAEPRIGDVAWVAVRGVPDDAAVEGSVGGRPLTFFPYENGQAALVGMDLDLRPGPQAWNVAVVAPGREPEARRGRLTVRRRDFPQQRLTLPGTMVDLDPETERRAVSESQRLNTLYRTITPERLWRGPFIRPVAGTEPGSGFGARRIINGQPRMPHGGADYSVPRGTPVLAANSGRVALIAEFFFPGRLVAVDHGLGLYTLYFHLDSVTVTDGERVDRGQTIGTVGATGRATGPHLHFATHVGTARVDPAVLLELRLE
jgi:murein DD-endopeptidase MepM/ murein hydrolase activator NlpD